MGKAELEETEEQIQDFESEKMSTLNELRMAVCLKMKQLQNLIPVPEKVEEYKAQHEAECRAKVQKLHERAQEEEMDDATLERLTRDIVQEADWRGYVLPRELKDSILFTRTQLLQLIDRKREIDEERKELQVQKNQDHRKWNIKQKEIQANEGKRAEAEKAYNEKRMLRFGNLIELESLEVGGPSAVVIELQNKFN